jgi:hypothetical protein
MASVTRPMTTGERLALARSRDAIIATEFTARTHQSPTTCSKRNGRFRRARRLALATHHSIGGKRVATGSHGLHESVLSPLLTHQLKVTDCNGLDGSNHPLKVKTRVRTPYGLRARSPRSEATFDAKNIAPETTAATHLATQSGRIRPIAATRRRWLEPLTWADAVRAHLLWLLGRIAPRRMWCHHRARREDGAASPRPAGTGLSTPLVVIDGHGQVARTRARCRTDLFGYRWRRSGARATGTSRTPSPPRLGALADGANRTLRWKPVPVRYRRFEDALTGCRASGIGRAIRTSRGDVRRRHLTIRPIAHQRPSPSTRR